MYKTNEPTVSNTVVLVKWALLAYRHVITALRIACLPENIVIVFGFTVSYTAADALCDTSHERTESGAISIRKEGMEKG